MEIRSRERDKVVAKSSQPEEESDDLDLFFKSIAKTVRSFPLHLKQRAKLETLSLISTLEMDMWSARPTSSTRSPTNFSTTPSPTPSGSSVGATSEGCMQLRAVDSAENQNDVEEVFYYTNK